MRRALRVVFLLWMCGCSAGSGAGNVIDAGPDAIGADAGRDGAVEARPDGEQADPGGDPTAAEGLADLAADPGVAELPEAAPQELPGEGIADAAPDLADGGPDAADAGPDAAGETVDATESCAPPAWNAVELILAQAGECGMWECDAQLAGLAKVLYNGPCFDAGEYQWCDYEVVFEMDETGELLKLAVYFEDHLTVPVAAGELVEIWFDLISPWWSETWLEVRDVGGPRDRKSVV